MKDPTKAASLVRDHIAQTMGTEHYYRAFPPSLKFTDGIKFVADTCQAHWLVTAIASHQRIAIPPEVGFQVWELAGPKTEDKPWILSCWSDTPGESTLLARQEIEYSDFPKELLPFRMWVEGNVLLLPAEH